MGTGVIGYWYQYLGLRLWWRRSNILGVSAVSLQTFLGASYGNAFSL